MTDPRSRKTKPGEFKAARQRHLDNQAQRDALKKLREGEIVEVKALNEIPWTGAGEPKVFRVRPLGVDEPWHLQPVLCAHARQLRVMTYIEKDGQRVEGATVNSRHIRRKEIFGAVIG